MFVLRDLPKIESLRTLATRIPETDPVAIETCLVTLRVASDLLDSLEDNMSRYGLSQGRFIVLMLLLRTPDAGCTPSQLADKAGVTRATMTGLLDGLEREGLIVREQASADRRNLFIHLTEKGRTFLDKMLPDHFKRIATLMHHLSDAEKGQLMGLMSKLNDGIADVKASA